MGLFGDEEAYERDLERRRVKKAGVMGKWVTVLFWLQIASIVGEVFSEELFEGIPVIYFLGLLITYGVMIANSVILIRLKEVEDWFGKAGICYLVSGCSGFVIAFLLLGGAEAFASLLTLAMTIVALRGNYDECTGYEVSLQDVDKNLSEAWATQWKLELICVLSAVGVSVLGIIGTLIVGGAFLIIMIILLLIIAIASLVIAIRRLIYIYRAAECFRNYEPNPSLEQKDMY